MGHTKTGDYPNSPPLTPTIHKKFTWDRVKALRMQGMPIYFTIAYTLDKHFIILTILVFFMYIDIK